MAQFLTQNRIVGFIAEPTAGTFEAPLAANFDVEMFDLTPIEWDYGFNRQGVPANGNLTQAQSKSGMIKGTFSGKTRLQYSGDQAVAPKQAKLWSIAGLQESGVGVQTIYTYAGIAPCNAVSAIVSDIECGSTPGAIDNKGRGIQAEMVINAPGVGQEVTCDYTFNCAYETEVDNAAPIRTLTGIDTGACAKLLNTTFSFGGNTYILHSFSLALGNTVSMIPDPSKTGGVFQYKITATDAKLTCQVQKIDIATSGIPADTIADTVFNPILISMANWDISITDANLLNPKDADAEGVLAQDLEFEVRAFTLTQKD